MASVPWVLISYSIFLWENTALAGTPEDAFIYRAGNGAGGLPDSQCGIIETASHNEQRFSASMSRIKRNNRMIILLTVLFGAFIAGFNTFKEVFLIT